MGVNVELPWDVGGSSTFSSPSPPSVPAVQTHRSEARSPAPAQDRAPHRTEQRPQEIPLRGLALLLRLTGRCLQALRLVGGRDGDLLAVQRLLLGLEGCQALALGLRLDHLVALRLRALGRLLAARLGLLGGP